MCDRNDLATSETDAAGVRERTPSRSHWPPRAIRRPTLVVPPAFRLCSVRSFERPEGHRCAHRTRDSTLGVPSF